MHSPASSTLYFLCSALLFHAFLTTAIDPLHAKCSISKNYTSNDAFGHNLPQMMSLLATKAAPIGFALGSVGHGDGRVNGLALCRGDVRSSACTSCILTAGARIRDLCPRNKEAVVWYDECMVRYSDAAFFGDADYDQSFPLFNPRNTFNTRNVSDPKVFDGKVALLLERLKNKAYISPLMFAKQELEIGDQSRNLYGLAQCTKDISGGDCKKCLEAAINKLRRCCRGQRGARVVGGSCNMRYELYAFLDDA
ncbi:cysteine-rich repeat secretory protein 38-like [Zingiber officinale]|uniref:cysteine-rich repeat secretory protein 38-like n=1 Tax=Zingiber officinale TaxID=94328 RepID=UPI001C4B3D26|nr:cysteine-rich repeat secretory protein 38-like [Zingiber officinale]